MPWYDGPMLAYDCESTSVDVETARIVTACFLRVGGGADTVRSDWLANPGIEIPEEASAIHGVTTERARAEGQAAPKVIGEIVYAFNRGIREGLPFIAYNCPYDFTVLDREARRYGIEPPAWENIRAIDGLVIWKWADRYRRGSRNLAAACECFDLELGADAHDAGADALAAGRLAYRMLRRSDLVQGRHPEIIERRALWKSVRDDLDRLQGAQRQWQAEQARGLADYFTAKGEVEKAATVRVGWPLVPYEAEVTA